MFTDKVEHNGKVTLEALVVGGDGGGGAGHEGSRTKTR
jgi:hypothetical protein